VRNSQNIRSSISLEHGQVSVKSVLLVGTKKGVFIGRSDDARRAWRFDGPHCSGTWAFNDVRYDDSSRSIYAGGASNWYGPSVWRSADLGVTWTHSGDGLTYGDGGPAIEQVWRVQPAHGALYAGVDPVGLFRSEDGGQTWAEVAPLRAHPSADGWQATNGGMPLHAILPHTQDAQQMWVAISAGGVYKTVDGGRAWVPAAPAQDACVHALVQTTDGALYQHNHAGVWRSADLGDTWTDVSSNLPSRFGFPLVAHPRDPHTVYAVPLQGGVAGERYVPGGQMAVWRTRDAGASWSALTQGFPQERTFLAVLRGALAVDTLDPAGIYAGTPTGHLFGSVDEGDTWFEVTRNLPPIYSVSCAVV